MGRKLPHDFRPPADSAAEIMLKHADPLSLDAVDDYFRLLYWKYGDRIDEKQIISRFQESWKECLFPFRSVDSDFEMISNGGEALIIPFDDNARGLIRALKHAAFNGKFLRQVPAVHRAGSPVGDEKTGGGGAVERSMESIPC